MGGGLKVEGPDPQAESRPLSHWTVGSLPLGATEPMFSPNGRSPGPSTENALYLSVK